MRGWEQKKLEQIFESYKRENLNEWCTVPRKLDVELVGWGVKNRLRTDKKYKRRSDTRYQIVKMLLYCNSFCFYFHKISIRLKKYSAYWWSKKCIFLQLTVYKPQDNTERWTDIKYLPAPRIISYWFIPCHAEFCSKQKPLLFILFPWRLRYRPIDYTTRLMWISDFADIGKHRRYSKKMQLVFVGNKSPLWFQKGYKQFGAFSFIILVNYCLHYIWKVSFLGFN
jgi:hypothetical protein